MKFHPARFPIRFTRNVVLSACLGILHLSPSVLRADTPPATPPESPQTETFEQEIIQEDIEITEWFKGIANGIDLFLVPKRMTNKANETHVKLETSSYALEGAGAANTENVSVALRLPNVEEYWQLKFSSYDEQQTQRNIETGYLNQAPKQQNYGATVGFFRMLGNIRTAFQPRVSFGNPLKISHSLTFETVGKTQSFQFNPRWELFADPDKGTGTDISLNLNFNLTHKTSLTFLNTAEYDEVPHLLTTGNGLSFGQILDHTSSLAYSVVFNGNNVGNYHLDNYSISTTYNHVFDLGIFELQIIPHWDFALLRSFRGAPGIVFNFNVVF